MLARRPFRCWTDPRVSISHKAATRCGNSLFPNSFPNGWPPQTYRWVTLQPGQSFTQTATWNGVPQKLPSADLSGTFTVSNELDPRGETSTFQLVAPATSLLTTTITTDKSVYDLGEPAQLTFTETDTGNKPIVVLTGPTALEITSNGSNYYDSTVWNATPFSLSWQTLQPGQSYTQTVTWDGYPDGDRALASGTFAVSDLLDPTGASATFQILSTRYPTPSDLPPSNPPVPNPPSSHPDLPPPISILSPPPVAIALSTEHVHYTVGQSVPISVVMKNVTASKVAIRQGHSVETVTVQHGSTLVYESARRAHSLTSAMINAGTLSG